MGKEIRRKISQIHSTLDEIENHIESLIDEVGEWEDMQSLVYAVDYLLANTKGMDELRKARQKLIGE